MLKPTNKDWGKLLRLLQFLYSTYAQNIHLTAHDLRQILWHIDTAYGVHIDLKSHPGGNMSLGKGAKQAISRKQKLVTRSSTEAELVATDDIIAQVLWTLLFMEAQGYPISENIIFQDNQSAIKLELRGKQSSGKQMRHLEIRYFFLADQIQKKKLKLNIVQLKI